MSPHLRIQCSCRLRFLLYLWLAWLDYINRNPLLLAMMCCVDFLESDSVYLMECCRDNSPLIRLQTHKTQQRHHTQRDWTCQNKSRQSEYSQPLDPQPSALSIGAQVVMVIYGLTSRECVLSLFSLRSPHYHVQVFWLFLEWWCSVNPLPCVYFPKIAPININPAAPRRIKGTDRDVSTSNTKKSAPAVVLLRNRIHTLTQLSR